MSVHPPLQFTALPAGALPLSDTPRPTASAVGYHITPLPGLWNEGDTNGYGVYLVR